MLTVALGAAASCRRPPPSPSPPVASARALATPERTARAPDAAPPLASASAAAPKRDVCALPVGRRAGLRAGASAKPFTRVEPRCPEGDAFCDFVAVSPDRNDACFVANDNLARAERESLGARHARVTSGPWDKTSAPRWLDRVDAHLHLDERESELLHQNGFVVLDRLGYASYAVAYHDVFQQELPVYVGVDAILNAVFQGSQMLLEEVETARLGPALARMIDRMRATLAASRATYGAETSDDLDVYLTVAHRLFHGDAAVMPKSGASGALVDGLVAQARAASGLAEVDVFGRARMIDFSQYEPRGHYANTPIFGGGIKVGKQEISLQDYFRTVTWLSRFEWNLVSRGCRSSQPGAAPVREETPREARDALALADLVARSGSLGDLRAFEDVYSVFAGRREDVSVPDLLSLARANGITPAAKGAPDMLRAAIGDRFQRTARTHFMPEGAGELPAIATLLGPRIVPDIAPMTRLVHDAIPDRYDVTAADLAYVLGHDRAKRYLADDLHAHPTLAGALDKSRAELLAGARGRSDVYSAWISAVARVAEAPSGALPSYAKTDAFADMRMSSALAGYAQIRHTFVLLAGQGYDAYGCEIPDGFVEPALGVYDGLLAWSRAARAAAPHRAKYFARVDEVLRMLRSIAATELSGAPLSEPQRRWLGMVAEFIPRGGYADSGAPPKWTGWYFDLFPDREHGAERSVELVADWFTLTNADRVRYVGVEKAALGVFVVDVGGEPRAMVGPVVKPYEVTTPIAARLDDERARTAPGKRAPWTASYLAPEKEPPPLAAGLHRCDDDARVYLESDVDLGEVSVTLLDHHGDPITEPLAQRVDRGRPAVFAFALGREAAIEGADIHVGDAGGRGRWDAVLGGSVYSYADALARSRAEVGIDFRPAATRGGR